MNTMVSLEASGLLSIALLRSSEGFKAAIWACLVVVCLLGADLEPDTEDAAGEVRADEKEEDGEEDGLGLDIASLRYWSMLK